MSAGPGEKTEPDAAPCVPNDRRSMGIAGAAFALAAFLLCVKLASVVVPIAPLPDWDEASYSFSGWYLHHAAAVGDWNEFAKYTHSQTEKPFLHDWLLAAVMGATEPGYDTARWTSAVLFAGCACLVFWLAALAAPDKRWVAGLVAGSLLLAMPIGQRFAVRAMLEVPGAFWTLSALLVFVVARRRRRVAGYALAGLLAAATFLTKYNYGLVLLAALAIEILIESGLRRDGLVNRFNAAFAVAASMPIVWWMTTPLAEKLPALIDFAVNRASHKHLLDPATLLFYPRAIASEYAPGAGAAVLLAAGLVFAIVRARDRDVRLLVICFGVGLLAATVHPYKLSRAIFATTVVLPVLAGVFVAACAARPGRAGRLVVVIGLPLILIAMATQFARGGSRLVAEATASRDPGREAFLTDLVDQLDPDGRNLVLGAFNELSPSLIQQVAYERYGRVFALRVDVPVPDDVYTRTGAISEFRPSICEAARREIDTYKPDVVVGIVVPRGSRYRGDDYVRWNEWKRSLVGCMAEHPDYEGVGAGLADGDDLKSWNYRRKTAAAAH